LIKLSAAFRSAAFLRFTAGLLMLVLDVGTGGCFCFFFFKVATAEAVSAFMPSAAGRPAASLP
jgi:hypothetical protein